MKDGGITLEWYEKRRGMCLSDKIKSSRRKKEFLEKNSRKKEQVSESSGVSALKKKTPAVYSSDSAGIQNKFSSIKKMFPTDGVPEDAKKIIEEFDSMVESTHPLNSRQKALLPKQIRDLSHYLTDERGDRRLGYMNQTVLLSAYVHYYTWWNLVRLVRLFSAMDDDFFCMDSGSSCLDIGSGPLTVPIALFLARPELRDRKLTFYCMDLSNQALSFGENIFLSVAARLKCTPWKIVRIKSRFGEQLKEKVSFITSANFFNELCDDFREPPDFLAKKYTDTLLSYMDRENKKTGFLIIEPGDPRSARLVSLMRDSFMRKGFFPLSPCTHTGTCPMDGKKGGKWCNFAFKTFDAPEGLRRLSAKSELPKERAVLSFIALQKKESAPVKNCLSADDDKETFTFRVASEPIKLPGGKTGYYACSPKGLLLVRCRTVLSNGDKISVGKIADGLPVDSKSGALILDL